ncbi:MAG: elongation factor P [Candidatus Neomarinimicrobiota bacterium]|nr:elongation factor P [Candidatus Neomarinimicrobiota bacterium]
MASTSDFKNGLIINHKNNLWKIVEFLHVKPGKGSAFVRSKLKNIKTGQVVEETFRAGEKIETVRVEARDYDYLYFDGDNYIFMDNETFEQISLTTENVSDVIDFLVENTKTTIAFNGSEPIEVRIPKHLNMEVVETDPGERGNTAQGGSKPAKLESGVTIQVPLFIQIGDKIRVDTKEKKYIERAK